MQICRIIVCSTHRKVNNLNYLTKKAFESETLPHAEENTQNKMTSQQEKADAREIRNISEKLARNNGAAVKK